MGFRAIILNTFGGLGRVHRVIGFDSRAHNTGFIVLGLTLNLL